MVYDMIISGGGPAGYTAALYGARAGMSVVILEKMSPGGQMMLTDVIDNYPGFENGIEGFELAMKMQAGAERFGVKTEYAVVTDVDFSDKIKKVETTNGTYYGKTVVIATGANPCKLGIEKENEFTGKGVHYCAHCDGRFYKGKTVAVVGGGNSAVQDALYLSRLAEKVYIIHRRDKLRAEKIYQESLNKAENIEFLWDSKVEEICTDERVTGLKIRNVKTDEEKEINCQALFVSIGRSPETLFLKGKIDLDENGYIIADETTRTNVNGVFAVGDVRTKPLRQIITATSDGAVAVHFAEKILEE